MSSRFPDGYAKALIFWNFLEAFVTAAWGEEGFEPRLVPEEDAILWAKVSRSGFIPKTTGHPRGVTTYGARALTGGLGGRRQTRPGVVGVRTREIQGRTRHALRTWVWGRGDGQRSRAARHLAAAEGFLGKQGPQFYSDFRGGQFVLV